jgi:hypothetical protein
VPGAPRECNQKRKAWWAKLGLRCPSLAHWRIVIVSRGGTPPPRRCPQPTGTACRGSCDQTVSWRTYSNLGMAANTLPHRFGSPSGDPKPVGKLRGPSWGSAALTSFTAGKPLLAKVKPASSRNAVSSAPRGRSRGPIPWVMHGRHKNRSCETRGPGCTFPLRQSPQAHARGPIPPVGLL